MPEQQPSLNLGIEPPALTPEVLGPNARQRRRGAIGRAQKWLQTRIREQGDDLVDTLIAAAQSGDMAAMRLCVEHGWGLPRKAPIPVEGMPDAKDPQGLQDFIRTLLARTAAGEIGPEDGEHLMRMAYLALQASELGPTAGGAGMIAGTDMRNVLAERLIRQIEMRRETGQPTNGNGSNGHTSENDLAAIIEAMDGSPETQASDDVERRSLEAEARADALLKRLGSGGQ